MRIGSRRKLVIAALLIGLWMSMSHPVGAQLHGGAAIALTATLPSSVSVSDIQLPVVIVVSRGSQTISKSRVNIKWNLDTRATTGFRVVGTLVGFTLPATSLEGRSASNMFRPLRQNRSIVLLEKVITDGNRLGELQTEIELQVNAVALGNLADGAYQGWLKLDAQIL